MKHFTIRLALLLIVVAGAVHAQTVTGPALAGTTVDLYAQFGNSIDNMVIDDGTLFLATANGWLDDFGPIALFFLILHSLRGGAHRKAWLLEYAFGFLVAKFLLANYSTPTVFLGGSTVSRFFLDEFKMLQNKVDISRLEAVFSAMANIVGGVESPSIWNPLKLMVYSEVLGFTTVLQVIVWVTTLAGLIGTGIGATIGSLFVPWFVFPSTRFITMRWLNFMLLTSAYFARPAWRKKLADEADRDAELQWIADQGYPMAEIKEKTPQEIRKRKKKAQKNRAPRAPHCSSCGCLLGREYASHLPECPYAGDAAKV